MHIIASILLAFSASLDSLIIGIAYGIKKIRIKFSINIIIALIVTLGTFNDFRCYFKQNYSCIYL